MSTVIQNGTLVTVSHETVMQLPDGTPVVTALASLTDVDTSGLVPGNILKYNGEKWVPAEDEQGEGGGGTGDGSIIYMGADAPASSLGANTDTYIRSNGDVYRKESGIWVNKFNIRGPQGQQGPQGQTGATGTPGDTGAQGPKGDKGDTGNTGLQGPKGDTGNTGAKGDTGNTGAAGKSAYQTWLDAGNTGTEAAFLAALKGVKGDTGNTGAKGDTGTAGRSIQVFTSLPTGSFGTNYFAGDIVML